MQASGHACYVALKKWNPSAMANAEHCINLGFQPDEISTKIREFTEVEVPEEFWQYLDAALKYLALKRDVDVHKN